MTLMPKILLIAFLGLFPTGCAVGGPPPPETQQRACEAVVEHPVERVLVVYPERGWLIEDTRIEYLILFLRDGGAEKVEGREARSPAMMDLLRALRREGVPIDVIRMNVTRGNDT